jgi:AcrR family transcriptional regulator
MENKSSYHHGDLKNALIVAGVEILAREGVGALSLRKVAKKAGVSHSAPYAHFKDKQALIAAISIEGFKELLAALQEVFEKNETAPGRLLLETAWVYMEFALKESDTFKVMFSGILEKENEYPDLVDVVQRTFHMVVKVVAICQANAVLPEGDAELTSTALWAQIHGLISLYLEGQISHTILDRYELKQILTHALNRFTLLPLQ